MEYVKNYYIKTKKIEPQQKGVWHTYLCEVYLDDEKLGEYTYWYSSNPENKLFQPVSFNGKDYAIISSNYNKIDILSLPDCNIIPLKNGNVDNMCPVQIYVPLLRDSSYLYNEKENEMCEIVYDIKEQLEDKHLRYRYPYFGLVSGCIWGDDTSWKLNFLDLSKIEQGELWYINEHKEQKWLYSDLPNACSDIKKIDMEFDIGDMYPAYIAVPTVNYYNL